VIKEVTIINSLMQVHTGDMGSEEEKIVARNTRVGHEWCLNSADSCGLSLIVRIWNSGSLA
jgi:hypothetical protein